MKTPVSPEQIEAYDRLLATHVTVPDDLLPDTDALAPWLNASYEYVTSLPLEPTKKGRSKETGRE